MSPNPQFRADWSHLLKKSLLENFIFCAVCAFPQNFHIMILGEISVFYAVNSRITCIIKVLTQLLCDQISVNNHYHHQSHYQHYAVSF